MLQAITRHSSRFKRGERGLSNMIVVMLSLVLVVVIVGNVVLWSYQMNQVDWEKMQEHIDIVSVEPTPPEDWTRFTFRNTGSVTSHLIGIWITNATSHQRYEANVFLNSGETVSRTFGNIQLPAEPFTVKVITERGNMGILQKGG
jgi:hypothetical protein